MVLLGVSPVSVVVALSNLVDVMLEKGLIVKDPTWPTERYTGLERVTGFLNSEWWREHRFRFGEEIARGLDPGSGGFRVSNLWEEGCIEHPMISVLVDMYNTRLLLVNEKARVYGTSILLRDIKGGLYGDEVY